MNRSTIRPATSWYCTPDFNLGVVGQPIGWPFALGSAGMRRTLIALVLALALSACGGSGHQADKAGYIAYSNAELQADGNTVNESAVDDLFEDFDCDEDSLGWFLAVADEGASDRRLIANRATIYFICGEDAVRDLLPASVADEMVEAFSEYDGG